MAPRCRVAASRRYDCNGRRCHAEHRFLGKVTREEQLRSFRAGFLFSCETFSTNLASLAPVISKYQPNGFLPNLNGAHADSNRDARSRVASKPPGEASTDGGSPQSFCPIHRKESEMGQVNEVSLCCSKLKRSATFATVTKSATWQVAPTAGLPILWPFHTSKQIVRRCRRARITSSRDSKCSGTEQKRSIFSLPWVQGSCFLPRTRRTR